MINLNAIVRAAHDGEGINSLAEQFGISPDEAQEAVQVLLPALSMGLQAQMQGPGFAQILSHLATPQNRAAFEDAEAAQSDETVAAGTDAINHLFGQEDVAGQVVENANQHSSTSLTSDLLQSMLPVIAAMVMGGLFKSIANKGGLGGMFGQAEAAPQQSGGGIGDLLGQMAGRQAPSAAPQQSGGGIGDILGQITGGGQQAQPRAQAPQQGGGGLGDMLDQMAGGQRGQAQGTQPQQGGGGLGDLLGGLLGGGQPQRGGAAAQQGAGGLGDLLGGLLGGGQPQRGGAAPQQGGGGLGDLLGGLLGGGQPQQGRGQAPGGIDPASIQAGLEQLSNMFGHGTKVSPQQQSGLDGILGQLFGGKR